MTAITGRNDPCPCGSGRKFKKCCLLKEQTDRPLAREMIGHACREAHALLGAFAGQDPEAVASTVLEQSIPTLQSEQARHSLRHELLATWYYYLWYPEEAPASMLPSDQTVAARFLREAKPPPDPYTRRYIMAAMREPFSFWQVESVSPGAGVLLSDLITGEERFVADLSISNSASRWDLLFAQVVGLDGLYILNGMGLYALPPARFRERVDALAESLRTRVGCQPDRRSLLSRQTEFMEYYLHCVDEVLHPPPPDVRNMDGDTLAVAQSSYRFASENRADVIKAIEAMRDIHPEAGPKGSAVFVWLAKPKSPGHKDKVVKGHIRIGRRLLKSECNSEARDNALRRRLMAALGPLVTHENTTLRPFDSKGMSSARAPKAAAQEDGAVDLAALPPDDRQRMEVDIPHLFVRPSDEIAVNKGRS
jgi:hypothetical protein